MLHHPGRAAVMFILQPTIHSICQAGDRAAGREGRDGMISLKRNKGERFLQKYCALNTQINRGSGLLLKCFMKVLDQV